MTRSNKKNNDKNENASNSKKDETNEIETTSLESKINKFNIICKKINRHLDNFEKQETKDLNLIKVIKNEISELKSELNTVYFSLDVENTESLYNQYIAAEDEAIALMSKIEKTETESLPEVEKSGAKGNQNLKLPKYEIPTFFGEFNQWISFKAIFTSTVIENSALKEIEKLAYLQSAVKGAASKLIKGFAVSEANFKPVWEVLCNRYDNLRELTFSHVDKLFSIKPIKNANSKILLDIIDTCQESLRNLKLLGYEENNFTNVMLIHHLISKLDDDLRQKWEITIETNTIPSFETLLSFLEKQSRGLKTQKDNTKTENKVFRRAVVNNAAIKPNPCIICTQIHPIYKCDQFNKANLTERWRLVRFHNLCSNCLRSNHFANQCRTQTNCKACNSRHHSLLHSFTQTQNAASSSVNTVQEVQHNPDFVVQKLDDNTKCLAGHINVNRSSTLLLTAIIKVKNFDDEFMPCKCLVDSGSQKSLITQACIKKLKLSVTKTNHGIIGINNQVAETSVAETIINFKSHFGKELFSTHALVVNKITTELPNFTLTYEHWPHLRDLILADPQFYKTSPIDILLGADIFVDLILGDHIPGPKGTPSAISSKLGYLLGGAINVNTSPKRVFTAHALIELKEELTKFWEVESLPTPTSASTEDLICEELYNSTTFRDASGRYVVRLPLKSDITVGETYTSTLNRFRYLETKLSKHSELSIMYKHFMREYLDLKHMESVPDNSKPNFTCYLPHHGVLKESSSTTKIRVVFDASMRSSNGKSLNDALFVGPKLQLDLFNILINFRHYPIALTADIEKMYRQIIINSNDSDFQRILWRFDLHKPIEEFRLLTVTYGTACAPFLAIRTLRQLANDEIKEFPEASKKLINDFYVDDLLSGADSQEEAKHLVNQLIDLLKCGGFSLRKWSSNVPEVLSDIPSELKSTSNSLSIQETESIKILGVIWNAKEDTFHINIHPVTNVNTKRQLLSVIARIFDPLGILSPTTIILKMLMQDLWRDKLSWDASIPDTILQTWIKFRNEIHILQEITIPRYIQTSNAAQIQLHGFCDASSRAYAASLYTRTTLYTGEIAVNLVAAKTRVAPVKSITLPRLELSAAVLLAELYDSIRKSLPVTFNDVNLWSDSEIILCWIASTSSKLEAFVSHRVAKIRMLTANVQWKHIDGRDNPADCASRGTMPSKLLNHKLWWSGPPWLRRASLATSNHSILINNHVIASRIGTDQENTHVGFSSQSKSFPDFLCKYSSFTKLIRVISYVKRFLHNCRNPMKKNLSFLTVAELNDATNLVIRLIQEVEFSSELALLKQGKSLPHNHKFRQLHIFIDHRGLVRVGGRLSKHQTLSDDRKHPVIIPKNHEITKSIIRHYHHSYLHAGTQLVLALLRQKYWIINGRSAVRQELRKCVTCFKLNAKPYTQMMGDLPAERITYIRPFLQIGIDYAGPFAIKPNMKRSTAKLKAYLCLIICMSTKAVHLELVSDLTSEALIAALRRFISRRGCPVDVYSDNATNFKGAANYLALLHEICKSQEVQTFCTNQAIAWHFIPPYAPNFGGLWEASVKLAKRHLLKTCNTALLNYEEVATLLCQVEACINSRPLIPLSSDPTDCQALTPGHFLIGAPLIELVEPAVLPKHLQLSSRWMLIQNLRRHFWTRWHREYLNQLQPRTKWNQDNPNLKEGDLVIIRDEQAPPLHWKLGRVNRVFPGADKKVRVVSVHTPKGDIVRPANKLSLLPSSASQSSPGAGGC